MVIFTHFLRLFGANFMSWKEIINPVNIGLCLLVAFCVKFFVTPPSWQEVACFAIISSFLGFVNYLDLKKGYNIISSLAQKINQHDQDLASLKLRVSGASDFAQKQQKQKRRF